MQHLDSLQLKEKHAGLGCLCYAKYMFGCDPNILYPTLALIGDIKSSPTESPLMEKKELKEAHCPILKQASTPAANYNSADPLPAPEERRVAFDIGDSDEADSNKEHRVAFDIGDSDDTDYSNSNDGKYAKIQYVLKISLSS